MMTAIHTDIGKRKPFKLEDLWKTSTVAGEKFVWRVGEHVDDKFMLLNKIGVRQTLWKPYLLHYTSILAYKAVDWYIQHPALFTWWSCCYFTLDNCTVVRNIQARILSGTISVRLSDHHFYSVSRVLFGLQDINNNFIFLLDTSCVWCW